jgi:hypothetical protein
VIESDAGYGGRCFGFVAGQSTRRGSASNLLPDETGQQEGALV